MKLLMTLNPENATDEEVGAYSVREAARAVVLDQDDQIALLYVANENYYKLPGGGLEGQEDQIVALRRECLEEIGVEIDVVGEVGMVVEYRKFEHLKQTSYCYGARVVGQKGSPTFTDSELSFGFEVRWMPLPEAEKLFNTELAKSVEGSMYIVERDRQFLKEAGKFFRK